MTRRFESKIKKGFAGIAIILAGVVALAIANSSQVRRANEAAARAEDSLRELEGIMVTLVDAETGMRGYVITGQESYLEPYDRAVATIDRRMTHLKQLLDGSVPENQIQQLQSAVTDQMAFRKSIVEKIKADGGSETARRSIRIDEGKRGMDDLRKMIEHLESSENRALVQRRQNSEAMNERTVGTLLLFVTLAIVLLISGLMLVRHYLVAREKLEEERNRFFTLSDDFYCVAGPDGFFKQVNPAAERILGFSAHELTSRPFLELVHPDDREATQREAEKLAHGERTVYFENRYRTKTGDYRWLLWSAAPAPKDNLIYAVAKDITDHKKTEQRIIQLAEESRQRAAELEGLNKELEAFSYSVSHDLRAPLRHIAGFSDMLQRHADGSLDEKGKRFLNTIIDSAKRMGTLIDDLLVFSRMGRSEMRREPVNLNEIVDETIAEFAPDIATRRVNWKRQPLPEVIGDRAMLKQVFVNLISNALKYSGTRPISEIEIGTLDEADETIFFVRDNGVGFDMAYANKLFGVFQRLHESTQFEGTGIGLANVRRIVARHGGRAWAEAELDKGATFYFSLPKAKNHAAA
jgi:PAS domain S-box-containing protein